MGSIFGRGTKEPGRFSTTGSNFGGERKTVAINGPHFPIVWNFGGERKTADARQTSRRKLAILEENSKRPIFLQATNEC
jgi:hypothetical protein